MSESKNPSVGQWVNYIARMTPVLTELDIMHVVSQIINENEAEVLPGILLAEAQLIILVKSTQKAYEKVFEEISEEGKV